MTIGKETAVFNTANPVACPECGHTLVYIVGGRASLDPGGQPVWFCQPQKRVVVGEPDANHVVIPLHLWEAIRKYHGFITETFRSAGLPVRANKEEW